MTTLVARDYRLALDFLRCAHESEERAPFSIQVLDALRRLIPCAIATYRESNERTASYTETASGVDVAQAEPFWDRYPAVRAQDPLPGVCPNEVVRTLVARSAQMSDFMSLSRFRRLDLYQDVCRPLGTNFVMKLFLPVPGWSAGFVLESDRRDFTRRDRDVLDLLAPHMVLVRRRGLALANTLDEGGAAVALTDREREVIRLVAHGLTNPEIAAALFIAPGTVRKHLDNAFRKLGVRSRAEAVAVALGVVRD